MIYFRTYVYNFFSFFWDPKSRPEIFVVIFRTPCIYRVRHENFDTAHRKVDGIKMNIKVPIPFSDICNNNRDINF